jgi:hypothetical protein
VISGYWCQGPNTQSNGCGVSCGQLQGSGSDGLNAQCAYTIYQQQGMLFRSGVCKHQTDLTHFAGLTAWATYNSGLCSSSWQFSNTGYQWC